MARKFVEECLVIASHNPNKIREIKAILSTLKIKIVTAADLGLVEPVEDGENYLENALIKAHAAVKKSGLPSLADDSGIEVEALGGLPGLNTAPYTKEMGGLLEVFSLWENNLAIRKNPSASFMCTQVLAWPDGHYEHRTTRVRGRLTFPPRGEHGHGYDPIFIPEGYEVTPGGHEVTMAEMPFAVKNQHSHRALALLQIVKDCFQSLT